MKLVLSLLIVAAALSACSSNASRARTPTPAPTQTGTPVSPPVATPTIPPATVAAEATRGAGFKTAVAEQEAVVLQTVRACMSPALPVDAPTAAGQLDTCLNRGEGGFRVLAVEGDMPVVIVETKDQPGSCGRAYDVILWRPDGGWQAQSGSPLLPDPVDDALLGAAWPFAGRLAAPYARVDATAGPLLAVPVGTAVCGSGPGTVPMLFALDGDTWRLTWDPRGTELATLSDPLADFADASGIEHVHVRAAMWGSPDPTGNIFSESHPGPHRYVDETWTRDGEGYVLTSSTIEPSSYNTLVNFVDRLSTGDDGGARELLADPSLLDTAKRLGLAQQPLGQRWMTNLDANTECCGPIRIAAREADYAGPPQPVVVTFVQRGGEWLISGIATE